jgi:gamma-glutamyl hydrolase
METLCVITSENYTILTEFDAEDAAAPLLYTDVADESHFFRSLPPDVVRDLQNSPIAMENHGKGEQGSSVSLARLY